MNDSDARPLANCTRPKTVIDIYNRDKLTSYSFYKAKRDVPMHKPITNEPFISCTSLLFQYLRTFIMVNKTEALAPIFRVATHMTATRSTAITAVSLIDHWGTLSADTWSRVMCHMSRLRYSAKIRLIAALLPVHRKIEYSCGGVELVANLGLAQQWLSKQRGMIREVRKHMPDRPGDRHLMVYST